MPQGGLEHAVVNVRQLAFVKDGENKNTVPFRKGESKERRNRAPLLGGIVCVSHQGTGGGHPVEPLPRGAHHGLDLTPIEGDVTPGAAAPLVDAHLHQVLCHHLVRDQSQVQL
eukprot:5494189-Pyramimonas_sp.AAC.2